MVSDQHKYVIITAANEQYEDLLIGWIGSLLNSFGQLTYPTIVLNCGLSQTMISAVTNVGGKVIEPEWDIPVTKTTPSFFKAMTARPNLPKYAADYDYILWVDADAWVQSQGVVAQFVEAACLADVACCLEADRNYCPFFRNDVSQSELNDRTNIRMSVQTGYEIAYSRHFHDDVAKHLSYFQPVNSGVFCAHVHSPLWSIWNDNLTKCIARLGCGFFNEQKYFKLDFLVEQLALNASIHLGQISPTFLPPICNWICNMRLPAYDKARRLFCEPNWPLAPIEIVHMTSETKRQSYRLIEIGQERQVSRGGPTRSLMAPTELTRWFV